MSHLSAEQLVDAIEGTLAATPHAHLQWCPACRKEVDELAAAWAETGTVIVPEPSPLFWQHLSARVHEAIAAEPAARHRRRWFEWPVLAPVAGLALLLLALVSAVDRRQTDPPAQDVVAALIGEQDPLTIDAAWDVLSDVVGPLDVQAAQEAGIATALGTADRFVLQLTEGEQEALIELLEQEVGRVGS